MSSLLFMKRPKSSPCVLWTSGTSHSSTRKQTQTHSFLGCKFLPVHRHLVMSTFVCQGTCTGLRIGPFPGLSLQGHVTYWGAELEGKWGYTATPARHPGIPRSQPQGDNEKSLGFRFRSSVIGRAPLHSPSVTATAGGGTKP